MIRRYRSIREMVNHAKELGVRPYSDDRNWSGPDSYVETCQKAIVGDRSLTSKAQALLRQLSTTIETPRHIWQSNVAGPICIVPDVLAGRLTAFRRRIETREEHQPIEVLVDVGSSASLSRALLEKRGIVVLALVLALGQSRPLSLHLIDCSNGSKDRTDETVITVRIETAPLDVAVASYALTSVSLVRKLMYGLETTLNNFGGGWPKGFSLNNPQPYYDRLLPRLNCDPKRTLLIPASRATDTLLTSPIDWINAQIARFTKETEDA